MVNSMTKIGQTFHRATREFYAIMRCVSRNRWIWYCLLINKRSIVLVIFCCHLKEVVNFWMSAWLKHLNRPVIYLSSLHLASNGNQQGELDCIITENKIIWILKAPLGCGSVSLSRNANTFQAGFLRICICSNKRRWWQWHWWWLPKQ